MSLSTTALNALHRELGGRLVDFAGWELPVQFTGIIAEHQHTSSPHRCLMSATWGRF